MKRERREILHIKKTGVFEVIGIGSKVGLLTVAETTERRKAGYMVWRCRCQCGGEIFLDTRCLQRGTVRDCGCMSVVSPGQRDISGMRFGKLKAVSPTKERGPGGSIIWLCKCDCGNEVKAELGQLTSGGRKSCGCLSHPPAKDLIGKRFGKLTVIGYVGKRAGMHRWRCLCDCGKETVAGQTLLQNGKTKSCGCLQAAVYKENLGLKDGTALKALRAAKNGRLIKSNTSGYNGVYFDKKRRLWAAQITFKGKTRYLGAFEELADAVKARQKGEELYDEFLRQVDRADSKNPISGVGENERETKPVF